MTWDYSFRVDGEVAVDRCGGTWDRGTLIWANDGLGVVVVSRSSLPEIVPLDDLAPIPTEPRYPDDVEEAWLAEHFGDLPVGAALYRMADDDLSAHWTVTVPGLTPDGEIL